MQQRIAEEIELQPQLSRARRTTPVRRLDEVRAVKKLCIRHEFADDDTMLIDRNVEAAAKPEPLASPTI